MRIEQLFFWKNFEDRLGTFVVVWVEQLQLEVVVVWVEQLQLEVAEWWLGLMEAWVDGGLGCCRLGLMEAWVDGGLGCCRLGTLLGSWCEECGVFAIRLAKIATT